MRWNEAHGIAVFRLTSNLIPFGSHAANQLAWWDEFAPRFGELGRLMLDGGMSISTHPGQYTVLASARPEVVDAAVAELEYHDRLLTAFGLDASHKIVLHAGPPARFAAGFERLTPGAAARLVLENDERWPLEPVLELAAQLGVPVVVDVFHHELAPSFPARARATSSSAWARRGRRRTAARRSTSRPRRRASAPARTPTRSTWKRSGGSPRRWATSRSTASSR